jgi:CRP-like cAMP-binding protein
MSLLSLTEGSTLIAENTQSPDLYIVLLGRVENSKWARHSRSWGPFQAVGALEKLIGAVWEADRITCQQASVFIVVSRPALDGLMSRIQAEVDQAKKLDFLSAYIPGMRSLGALSKEKLSHCFNFVHVKSKKKILCAGESAASAYIIASGECLEVSEAKRKPSQGLASRTMSQVNFGLVTKGQWLGAESILEGKMMEFEVVTVSEVQAYQISRSDMLEKLGRDTIVLLKEQLTRQNSWRSMRKSLIETTFSPYIPPPQSKVIFSGTPAVNKRIRQLQSQQEEPYRKSDFSSLHRPQTAPIRPVSAASGLSLSFWFAQFPKNSANPGLRPQSKQEGKRHLALAATLGKAMVPTVVTKKLGRTQSVGRCTPLRPGSVKDHFGYNAKREEQQELTYMQRVRRPRPDSPNPMNASTSWLIGK